MTMTKGSKVTLRVPKYSYTADRVLKIGHVGTVLGFSPKGDVLVKFKQLSWPHACAALELEVIA